MNSINELPSTYVPEGPAEYFATLLAACQTAADGEAFYGILGQTLRLAAEEKTAFCGLTLGGLFAKIDYLAKECGLSWALRQRVNGARVRIARKGKGAAEGVWRHDLQAVSEFIAEVYQVALPAELAAFFPAEAEKETDAEDRRAPSAVMPYERVVVLRWDEEDIYVSSEDDAELRVAMRCPSGDWTYLTKLLHVGAQLNLVRPRRTEEGGVQAELIIYEPDYLVDISSVAGCFEEYSHSPFLHLLHRLQRHEQTGAILLGNLAGQILDDEVHGRTSDEEVRQSEEAFLRDNALTLLALSESDGLDVKALLTDSRAQRQHIRRALHEGLGRHVGSYHAADVMLEPSFVSEMLGLQGRMDFLQLDHRVLIEQKAGKGAYNPGQPETPRQQTKHYVQMLLYMALLRYNFHEQYAANEGRLQAFLLYSRYEESLLGLGPAPALLLEALRVRNGIVWYEEFYAGGGGRILEKMTADKLNQNGVGGVLWERYQRPQLETFLSSVRQASQLERDYYFRMLQFIVQEHRMAKVGNNTQQANCYASKWYNSLAEKHESGEIYDALRYSPSPDLPTREGDDVAPSGIREVWLNFPADHVADTTNFRLGDVVILYPYDEGNVPDCRRTMVHRGTLVEMTATGVRVKLRAAQSDARVFRRDAHRLWAIEHDAMESSFTGLYGGLHAFLSAPKERRDLLLLQREPEIDASDGAKLRGDYGAFNDLAQRVRSARDLFLIIGPPGTGKTSYGMLNTLKEQLADEGTNVLVLSYTNRAVDEICSKLVEEGIDFLRIGNEHNCDAAYRSHLLSNVNDALRYDDDALRYDNDALRYDDDDLLGRVRGLIERTRVFVGTTTTMTSQHALFALKRFDLAIIDEASQILEPHLLGLLSEQHGDECAIRKIVMIGDHKQLPAVVQQSAEQSAVAEDSLRGIGLTDCRCSLFERLLRRYGDNPSVTYMLHRQGRMHREIADFPSRFFYAGQLDVVPLPHQVEEGDGPRLVFLPSDQPKGSVNDKVNAVEARIIADLVQQIGATYPDAESAVAQIGVIVPYRNQITAIRSLLPEGLRDITIDTVERYQGSQRDHIIYGFTIQKHYQLAFLTSNVFIEDGQVIDRKLNVAMTRARKHLYLVGNPDLLRRNQTFARLIDFATNASQ